MHRCRIFKRFELLQINVSVFLFEQSKIDEDKVFVLEEHLGTINRYSGRALLLPGCRGPVMGSVLLSTRPILQLAAQSRHSLTCDDSFVASRGAARPWHSGDLPPRPAFKWEERLETTAFTSLYLLTPSSLRPDVPSPSARVSEGWERTAEGNYWRWDSRLCS